MFIYIYQKRETHWSISEVTPKNSSNFFNKEPSFDKASQSTNIGSSKTEFAQMSWDSHVHTSHATSEVLHGANSYTSMEESEAYCLLYGVTQTTQSSEPSSLEDPRESWIIRFRFNKMRLGNRWILNCFAVRQCLHMMWIELYF